MTGEVLGRAGISESLIPRTLQALLVLDLIDEKGAPTGILEGIRLAPEAEYKQRLSEWLKSAYADVLRYVDPAVDDETKIRDAFRSYNPVGQQPRMISLFQGLIAAAGMGQEKPAAQPRRKRTVVSLNPRTQNPSSPAPRNGSGSRAPVSETAPSREPPPPPKLPEMSEKALEYRLVDLMSEASGDPEVMAAIIKVITFLKTKNAKESAK